MQRLKLVVLAGMAVLSLSALASASTSAVTPATILPEEEVKLTGKQVGAWVLTALGGAKIECKTQTSEGSFAAKAKLGPITTKLGECKEASTGATCTGLGEASGTILMSGEAHLVVDNEPILGGGLLFLVNLTHFACSIVLTELKGEVLCLIKPANTKTTHFEGGCTETAAGSGDPKEVTYWNEVGEEVTINKETAGLLMAISHAAFKGAAEALTAELTASKEVTIDV